jgi:hypothetical protein
MNDSFISWGEVVTRDNLTFETGWRSTSLSKILFSGFSDYIETFDASPAPTPKV